MIYTNEDNHVIIRALKKKGWKIFDLTYARPSEDSGMSGGWWIDCHATHGTEHFESHKAIDCTYLGRNIKHALWTIKNNKFPVNN